MFCRSHCLGFHVFPTEHSQDFCQILSVQAVDVFERLQRITTHESVETCSLTPAGLTPRAGGNSNPHQYKEVQK